MEDGKIRFIQSKTGARVRVRAVPALIERLHAARMRRITLQMKLDAQKSGKKAAQTIVVDSRTGETFKPFTFRHRFARLREMAAKTTPSLNTLLFLDLRDTAVTWLANAGATVAEISAITGHSHQTAALLRRVVGEYPSMTLEKARERARAAIEDIAKGIDPKEKEKEAAQVETKRRDDTFAAVAEQFFKKHCSKIKSGKEYESTIRRECFSAFAKRPITSIVRRDMVAVIEELVEEEHPYAARARASDTRLDRWLACSF